MKHIHLLVFSLSFLILSCRDKPIPHFSLVIENVSGDTTTTYTLNDTSLLIQQQYALNGSASTVYFATIAKNYRDTLTQIAQMKVRSYSCSQQHALEATTITFTNDSGTVHITPNINHPKELDAAVRIFNTYAPAHLHLQFVDMQEAIEPDGQMRL
jgi:hypothetical protein